MMMKIKNPWHSVSYNSRVAEADFQIVQKHNNRYASNPNKQISEIGISEPFIGDPNAPVYLLQGSPLVSEDDLKKGVRSSNASFNEEPSTLEIDQLNNLLHKFDEKYPLFYLKPQYEYLPGHQWYCSVFKGLADAIRQNKMEEEVNSIISRNIFVCELYGYHSLVTHHSLIRGERSQLPSVQYTAALVRKAMSEGKLILLARGVNSWFTLIPELQDYENCHFVASNRGITLAKSTLSPSAWKQLMQLLNS